MINIFRPKKNPGNNMFFDLLDDGVKCLRCGFFVEESSLEEQCPGITAKIINAQHEEDLAEDTPLDEND